MFEGQGQKYPHHVCQSANSNKHYSWAQITESSGKQCPYAPQCSPAVLTGPNTDSSSTRLYLISVVFSEKTIKFNWRELFQWKENTASAELTQLLVCTDRWVFSSMNQFWFFSFFSCKIGMWTFLPYSIRMSYRY